MRNSHHFSKSIWFASLVALVVALGTNLLLESILPIAAFDWLETAAPGDAPGYRIAGRSFWKGDSILRLVSFGFGAAVACLLAWPRSWRLIASLVLISALATVFAQFPGRSATWQLMVWSLAGPAGAFFVSLAMVKNSRDV